MRPDNKDFLPLIESIRGVSAVLVAVFHLSLVAGIGHADRWLGNAYLLVDLFFVLSGFIIAKNFQYSIGSGSELCRFAIRRFGRIYPLHLLTLLALLPVIALQAWLSAQGTDFMRTDANFPIVIDFSLPTFFSNLVLIQALGLHEVVSWNAPAWSISVEFYTYLIFGLLCLVFIRSSRWVLYASVMLISFVLLFQLYFFQFIEPHRLLLFRCSYHFFWGALIAAPLLNLLRNPVKYWLADAIFISLILVNVYFSISVAQDRHTTLWSAPLYALSLMTVLCCQGRLYRFFIMKPFIYLGKISYSIYLTHVVLIYWAAGVLQLLYLMSIDLRVYSWLWRVETQFFIYLGIVFLVSHLTYYYCEEPARKYFSAIATKFRPSAVGRKADSFQLQNWSHGNVRQL